MRTDGTSSWRAFRTWRAPGADFLPLPHSILARKSRCGAGIRARFWLRPTGIEFRNAGQFHTNLCPETRGARQQRPPYPVFLIQSIETFESLLRKTWRNRFSWPVKWMLFLERRKTCPKQGPLPRRPRKSLALLPRPRRHARKLLYALIRFIRSAEEVQAMSWKIGRVPSVN